MDESGVQNWVMVLRPEDRQPAEGGRPPSGLCKMERRGGRWRCSVQAQGIRPLVEDQTVYVVLMGARGLPSILGCAPLKRTAAGGFHAVLEGERGSPMEVGGVCIVYMPPDGAQPVFPLVGFSARGPSRQWKFEVAAELNARLGKKPAPARAGDRTAGGHVPAVDVKSLGSVLGVLEGLQGLGIGGAQKHGPMQDIPLSRAQRAQESLEQLIEQNGEVRPFPALLPNSRWAPIDARQGLDGNITGIIYEDAHPLYHCLAVPGRRDEECCHVLEQARFLPAGDFDSPEGFWVSFEEMDENQ